jgi:hypothetical protein
MLHCELRVLSIPLLPGFACPVRRLVPEDND